MKTYLLTSLLAVTGLAQVLPETPAVPPADATDIIKPPEPWPTRSVKKSPFKRSESLFTPANLTGQQLRDLVAWLYNEPKILETRYGNGCNQSTVQEAVDRCFNQFAEMLLEGRRTGV
ncbi:hypothetical protein GQ602_004589 [Ophiocordyceps camponoti-floridani]|uniref:Uncharacterized protein n=1 Tax=Ophiocordyceps camponoti-floridani TaxID=2030778 RepID=A0A8H4Q7K0_9HYPO|nr:hypothetical protein GQ602_004589 [Ophiocordyceps camponoti-floridani]